MTKIEILKLMNDNPVFYLATAEEDQPRVRGMLLFRADEDGIVFHTASTKEVYKQILKNPKAELCFQGAGSQIRVTGVLELVEDETLREEIMNHPTRQFLQAWKAQGIEGVLQVFCMKNAAAVEWTMEKNFDEKEYVNL